MRKIISLALLSLLICFSNIASAPLLAKDEHKTSAQKKAGKPKSKLTAAQEIKEGKALFGAYDCASCHSIDGKGCADGVSLDHEGTKRTEQFILDQLKDPEAHVSKNPKAFGGDPVNLMPKNEFEPNELRLICKYLYSLK